MKLRHDFHHASGPTLDECHLIVYRSDARWDFDAESGESIVVQRHLGQTHLLLRQQGELTGLWRSLEGAVYVSYLLGGIYRNSPAPRRDTWAQHYFDAMLHGIWGLDEEHVFAWGTRSARPFMVTGGASGWREIPAPGHVLAMHGVAEDVVVAVGRGGLVARWDGSAWSTMASPTADPLASVFVVSADEMYACSTNGIVLEGSVYGWSRVVERAPMLNCVAKHDQTVWVGSTLAGLHRLESNQLILADASLRARAFDVRAAPLVSTPARVVELGDGAPLNELTRPELIEATDHLTPTWLTGRPPEGPESDS